MMKTKLINTIILIAVLSIAVSVIFTLVTAAPIGPTATNVKNETRTIPSNISINESTGGGYIYTYIFDAVEQNQRWKAYVGNVTGTLTLDDANSYSIYDWDLGTVTGEIYATRSSATVSWTSVNCSWGFTGNFTNMTILLSEDSALQHTRKDNITNTFDNQRNHSAFSVGDNAIPADSCYSIFTFVNNTRQTTTTYFPEVVLYDGTNETNGKVIYAAIVENDKRGYNGNDPVDNATYDFQMIVPEVGTDSWASSTPYYFYVELI